MYSINKILKVFNNREKKLLIPIIIGVLFSTVLEMFGFAIIIPVFNIVFMDKSPDIEFLNLSFENLDFNIKYLILILFGSIYVFKNIFLIFFYHFYIKFFYDLNIRFSSLLFRESINQNYKFFQKNSSEFLLRKVTTDIDGLKLYLMSYLTLIIEFIFIFSLSILLLIVNYKIFIFSMTLFIAIFFVYYKTIKTRVKNWSYDYQLKTGKLQNLVVEGLKGIKDIIIYRLENFFSNSFYGLSKSLHSSHYKIEFLNHVQRFWMELIAIVAMIGSLFYFIYVDNNIQELIPVFGLYAIAIFRVVPTFNRIIYYVQNLKFHYPSYEAITKDFSNLNINKKSHNPIYFENKLELNDISCFFDDHKVLENLNFKILKGDIVAITGKNGSGKTTLLNIIAGLLKPNSGKIILDEISQNFFNNLEWNKKISYVQQNIFLIDATIKENIMIADLNSKKFDVISEQLSLTSFFSNLPDGLDTRVGADGAYLSGGQKQIISIARALIKDSEIILLDEPDSALDKNNTKILKNILLKIKGDKTVIMISHSDSVFDECFDKKFLINDGKILEKTI